MSNVTVEIRNNHTGEIRSMDTTLPVGDDGKPSIWQWDEDGYSCDCNRELFFYREASPHEDEPQPYGDEFNPPCVDGGYSVRITGMDGEVLLDEFDDDVAGDLAVRKMRLAGWVALEKRQFNFGPASIQNLEWTPERAFEAMKQSEGGAKP